MNSILPQNSLSRVWIAMVTSWIGSYYTLYPGLLTPVFVIGSTNVREGLVELFKCNDVARHWMDVWRSGTFPEKPQVGECTSNRKYGPQINWVLDIRKSWQCFLSSESHFTAVQKKCATPPHVHPTSMYVIARGQFYRAFPRIGTVSDKRWGEKAWIQS